MIEADVYNYLCNNASLIKLIPASNIFLGQAPDTAKMPYVLFEIFSGTRNFIGGNKIENINPFKISVFVGSNDKLKGKLICDTILHILEHIRGKLGASNDVAITCAGIGLTINIFDVYTYSFTGRIRYIDT